MNPCLAFFVKTPGHSELKTRLAATIGKQSAEIFYRLSVKALQAVVTEADFSNKTYWAVAETEAASDPMWSSYPTVNQGDGTLGERLHQVYSHLLKHHDCVLLMGADSPQLKAETILAAVAALQSVDSAWQFVLGRADDGGFYLFGGNTPLPRTVWTDIAYSQNDTAQNLVQALAPHGAVFELPRLMDIDTGEDLKNFYTLYKEERKFLPEQYQVLEWIKTQLA